MENLFMNELGDTPGKSDACININFGSTDEKINTLLPSRFADLSIISKSASLTANKSYPVPILSKFETDSFDKKKEKSKKRIEEGVSQVIAGRVFKGAGFVAKPSELLFQDFEVGKKYIKRFTLTNASYTFNSFNILPFEPEVEDFFTISYQKLGQVSVGVSCTVELIFTSLVNEDIDTSIEFFSETGPGSIPIRCRKRRCAPKLQLTSSPIEFGQVVIGQLVSKSVTVMNTQYLPSKVAIERVVVESVDDSVGVCMSSKESLEPSLSFKNEAFHPQESDQQHKLQQQDGSTPATVEELGDDADETRLRERVQEIVTSCIRKKQEEYPQTFSVQKAQQLIVPGYSSLDIIFDFLPLSSGAFIQQFKLIYEDVERDEQEEDTHIVQREEICTMSGIGVESSIYLETIELDFDCVYYNKVYRKSIEVRNRSNITVRADVRLAIEKSTNKSLLSQWFEISPSRLFIPGGGAQGVNIKFTPTLDMINNHSMIMDFLSPIPGYHNAYLMILPIRIDIANEELPIYFNLHSKICSSKLQLSTHILDFGDVYYNTQPSTLCLEVTNPSLLPQKIMFLQVPTNIKIEPNFGMSSILLPKESVTFSISYQPTELSDDVIDLTILSNVNEKYKVLIRGRGIHSPVQLSFQNVNLYSSGPGQSIVKSVFLENTTDHDISFEIVLPLYAYSWLHISPSAALIPQKCKCRVEITYNPPINAMTLNPIEFISQINHNEEFISIKNSDCWVTASNMFGELQIAKTKDNSTGSAANITVQSSDNPANILSIPTTGPIVVEPEQTEPTEPTKIVEETVLPTHEWGIFAKWNVPIFIHSARSISIPLFLEVNTSVIPPFLHADTQLLDFGNIAIGSKGIKKVTVTSNIDDDISLKVKALSEVGPFSIVNAVRMLVSGGNVVLLVECMPKREGIFSDIIVISNKMDDGLMVELSIPIKCKTAL